MDMLQKKNSQQKRMLNKSKRRRRLRRIIVTLTLRFLFLAVIGLSLLRLGSFVFTTPERGNEKTVIVLDAGHGGTDPGTLSGQVLEKDINWEVVQLLKEKLKSYGADVLLSRIDDTKVDLSQRAIFANENQADIFVSIHCNYVEQDMTISGLECYSLKSSEESNNLSDCIVEAAQNSNQIEMRGARNADYKVLRETGMPAVLVELGYMSNPAELEKLKEKKYQKLLAEVISNGIVDYLERQE